MKVLIKLLFAGVVFMSSAVAAADDKPLAKDLAGKPRVEALQLAIVLNLPADAPVSERVDANALIGDDPAREQRRYIYLAVDENTKVLQKKPMMVAAEASPLIFEAFYSWISCVSERSPGCRSGGSYGIFQGRPANGSGFTDCRRRKLGGVD